MFIFHWTNKKRKTQCCECTLRILPLKRRSRANLCRLEHNELDFNDNLKCFLFRQVTIFLHFCVCTRLCCHDLAFISIIIRTKDAQALTDRPSPTESAWAFVRVPTQTMFSALIQQWLLSTSVQLYVCLGTHLTVCACVRVCVSGSKPSQAYY